MKLATFLILRNFQRFSCLAVCETNRLYTMFISNNRASYHLSWKENLVKHQIVSKYYENDCRLSCTIVRPTLLDKYLLGFLFISFDRSKAFQMHIIHSMNLYNIDQGKNISLTAFQDLKTWIWKSMPEVLENLLNFWCSH